VVYERLDPSSVAGSLLLGEASEQATEVATSASGSYTTNGDVTPHHTGRLTNGRIPADTVHGARRMEAR
jgi:hypothetical protein